MNREASASYPAEMIPAMPGKGAHVRQVFEDAPRYLKSRRVDICFRQETVRAFARDINARKMLDIGCGDGSISLPLLTSDSHLTLMDLSASMVARVKENVPSGLSENVEIRNENFAIASFDSQAFDLVITVGVMAHVDSPDIFLGKIHELLPPGGRLILEFTDAYHPVGRIGRFWGWLKERIAPAKYRTNKLSFAEVARVLRRTGFRLDKAFRYSRVPLPLFNRLVSHAAEYRFARWFFGDAEKNRNAWLGNEYICLLSSEEPAPKYASTGSAGR